MTGRDTGVQTERRAKVLAAIGLDGPDDLDDVAARCARLRLDRGRRVGLWTADRLADVLAAAVLDAGWPAEAAVSALLTVAADPATRSPARLSRPGPWWDGTPAAGDPGRLPLDQDTSLGGFEERLAETDGRHVHLQRQARAELTAEGQLLTRDAVVRRAVEILDRANAAEAGPEDDANGEALDDGGRLLKPRRTLAARPRGPVQPACGRQEPAGVTGGAMTQGRDLFGRSVLSERSWTR